MSRRVKTYKHLPEMFDRNKWAICKGDTVKVMVGRDKGRASDPGAKGKIGTVTEVIRDKRRPRVILDKVLQVKKRIRGDADNPGRLTLIDAAIPYSNVQLVAPGTEQAGGTPTRVTRMVLPVGGQEDEQLYSRFRLAKFNFAPMPSNYKPKVRDTRVGPKATKAAEVQRQTYFPPGDTPALGSRFRQFSTTRGFHSSRTFCTFASQHQAERCHEGQTSTAVVELLGESRAERRSSAELLWDVVRHVQQQGWVPISAV